MIQNAYKESSSILISKDFIPVIGNKSQEIQQLKNSAPGTVVLSDDFREEFLFVVLPTVILVFLIASAFVFATGKFWASASNSSANTGDAEASYFLTMVALIPAVSIGLICFMFYSMNFLDDKLTDHRAEEYRLEKEEKEQANKQQQESLMDVYVESLNQAGYDTQGLHADHFYDDTYGAGLRWKNDNGKAAFISQIVSSSEGEGDKIEVTVRYPKDYPSIDEYIQHLKDQNQKT